MDLAGWIGGSRMGRDRPVEEGTGGSWYDPTTTVSTGIENRNSGTKVSAT